MFKKKTRKNSSGAITVLYSFAYKCLLIALRNEKTNRCRHVITWQYLMRNFFLAKVLLHINFFLVY